MAIYFLVNNQLLTEINLHLFLSGSKRQNENELPERRKKSLIQVWSMLLFGEIQNNPKATAPIRKICHIRVGMNAEIAGKTSMIFGLVQAGDPVNELTPYPPLFSKRGVRPTKEVGGEFIHAIRPSVHSSSVHHE